MAKGKAKAPPSAPPLKRRWLKRLAVGLAAIFVLGLVGVVAARKSFRLKGQTTTSPMAALTHELQLAIQHATDGKTPGNLDAVIDLSVEITGRYLTYGRHHRVKLAFDAKQREGHPLEFATLFASIFNQLARWAKLEASAAVVHSNEARALGRKLGDLGHDWVVVDTKQGERRFVDPTLGAMHLGWNLERNVEGDVPKMF